MSASSNEDLNDFDVDDDMLADLLYDDSDPSFKKKEELAKKSEKIDASPKKILDLKENSFKKFPLKKDDSEEKVVSSAINSPEKKAQDILSSPASKSLDLDTSFEFSKGINSGVNKTSTAQKISSPKKKNVSKVDWLLEEESKYVDSVGVDETKFETLKQSSYVEKKASAPVKGAIYQSPKKSKEFDIDFDSMGDIFDDIDGISKTSPQKNVKNDSALSIKKDSKDEDEALSLGGYVPSARTPRAGRRKSVKFDDEISNSRPLFNESRKSSIHSPQKVAIPRSIYAEQKSPQHSSSTNKKDDDDWLNILNKDIPSKKSILEQEDSPIKEQTIQRRKSSSAEWLGLSTDSKRKETNGSDSNVHQHNVATKEPKAVPNVQKESGLPPWLLGSSNQTSNPLKSSLEGTVDESARRSTSASSALAQHVGMGQQVPNAATHGIMGSAAQIPSQSLVSDIASYQTMVNSLQLERDQLLQSIAASKKDHSEQLESFQANVKREQKSLEESIEQKLKSAKEEYESEIQKWKKELYELGKEKNLQADNFQMKIENLEKEHQKNVEKLKDLHNDAISMIKQDHKEATTRLKNLKEQEIEAISSTQLHSKLLASLSDELKMRASELAALQIKVEGKHELAVQEKETLLATKEKELKALEGRLKWQMEEGDEERTRLQKIILHLEKRLQQQTTETEQDRWDIQKTKAKLDIQWKFLEEEKKLQTENLEREKEKLRLAHESLIQEQKTILLQLAQERQQLSSEKLEFEMLSKRLRDEEIKLNAKQMKCESFAESERRIVMQEQEKLQAEKDFVKQESHQLHYEREALQREKRLLKQDRQKIEDARLELKRKSSEVEELSLKASADREEGRTALSGARKIESGHHARMNQFTQQMQILMEKEKQMLGEKEKLSDARRDLEHKKDSMLCASCKLAIGLPMMALPPTTPVTYAPVHQPAPRSAMTICEAPPPPNVDPSLLVWYVSAQKDREFLEEELSYLQSLKDSGRTKRY